MDNSALISQIRRTKGPIYATVHGKHETYYIQVVKTDLIAVLKPGQLAPFKLETSEHGQTFLEPV